MNNKKDTLIKIAILEAAKRVFQRWGLNKTTMEDIAHEAGKGKSTLYYYYKSKEEIFEAVATAELSAIFEKVKMMINEIKSPKEKLRKYISITLIEMKKSISIYPLVKGEIKGNRELIDKIRKQIDTKEEIIIMEIFNQGIASGEFQYLKETQLSKVANAIVGIIRALEFHLFFDNDDDEKIDIITKIIAGGI